MREVFIVSMAVLSFVALSKIKTVDDTPKEPEVQTKEEREAAYEKGPKYHGPNEYTLKNGCKFRSTQGAMFVRDPKDRKSKWMLVVNKPLNEWTKKCSMMPRFFAREEDVVKVRYK